jgi:hypothetical protein
MSERCPHCRAEIESTAQTCPHCGKGLSGKALLSPYEQQSAKRRDPRVVARICWVVSLFASLGGCAMGLSSFAEATSAPQEAAAAAGALLIIVGPYVFARAVDEITRD